MASPIPDGSDGDGREQQAEADKNLVHPSPPGRHPRPNRLKALLTTDSPNAAGTAQVKTRRNPAHVLIRNEAATGVTKFHSSPGVI